MPTVTRIHYAKKSRLLQVGFDDGTEAELSAELLRVYSPSAEVRGHGDDQAVLQTGKAEVVITGIQSVGHYAVQLVFDDGHDSGLYTWDYLYHLSQHSEALWQDYLDRLAAAGGSRDPHTQVIQFTP